MTPFISGTEVQVRTLSGMPHGRPRRSGYLAMQRQSANRQKSSAERCGEVLTRKGLTITEVSRRSEALYGRASPHFIPHNFLSSVNRSGFIPSIYQVFALSQVSGFKMLDWLHLFGVDVKVIPQLQASLEVLRTTLISYPVADTGRGGSCLRNRTDQSPASQIVPFSEFLQAAPLDRPQGLADDRTRFLYVKVGWQDAIAFPDLLPQSILRIDASIRDTVPANPAERLYLIEHASGYCCSAIRAVGGNRVVLMTDYGMYSHLEFELDRDARLHGVVDREIRPLGTAGQVTLPYQPTCFGSGETLVPRVTLPSILRRARILAGLSLRDASAITKKIADLLHDRQYFLSASLLSDLEASGNPPRHMQKLIALCVVYALDLNAVFGALGTPVESGGLEPIRGLSSDQPNVAVKDITQDASENMDHGGLLSDLFEDWGEIPPFIGHALGPLLQLTRFSLRDLFWISSQHRANHVYLVNASVIAVNRHKKRPRYSHGLPAWLQPLYLVLKRDGSYVCSCCKVDGQILTMLYPYTHNVVQPERLRLGADAEVVGEVVMIARKLP
jgi:hypothetical protein